MHININQTGYSLLEVLVALLVLSIGLLGVAALQATGLKFNHESYLRTQAVFQVYDILDRIRANPAGKAAGRYDAITMGNIPTVSTDCGAAACSSAEMATYDIAQWNTNNGKLLPAGEGKIETVGTIRTVTIEWEEKDMKMSINVMAEI